MKETSRRSLNLSSFSYQISSVLYYRRKILLLSLALSTLFVVGFPIKNAKAMVVPTPVAVADGMSMEANRIATLNSGAGTISVYDIPTAALVTFPAPAGVFVSTPQIYDDKIVLAAAPGLLAPSTIFYCVLPVPLAACGPWIALVAGVTPPASLALWGFPVFRGDIVAWPIMGGLSYYSFHAGAATVVPTGPLQPVGLSTNGDVISFVDGGFLNYLSTTSCIGPCVPVIVPTGLPADPSNTGITQNVIAFVEPGPTFIRHYDILSGVANPAGTGPIGTLGAGGVYSSLIWNDRIVFQATEASVGFDCNGDAIISPVDRCVRYWNFRNPVALLLPLASPALAPGGAAAMGISGRYIAYVGAAPVGVKFVTVPMTGDVNLDGRVDILDAASLAFCFDQLLKGVAC